MGNQKLLAALVFSAMICSCNKKEGNFQPKNQLQEKQLKAQLEFGKQISLSIKDNRDFANALLKECITTNGTGEYASNIKTFLENSIIKTKNGNDYNITASPDLMSSINTLQAFSCEPAEAPEIFYPRAETIEYRLLKAQGIDPDELDESIMANLSKSNPKNIIANFKKLTALDRGLKNNLSLLKTKGGEYSTYYPPLGAGGILSITAVPAIDPTDLKDPGFIIDNNSYGLPGYPIVAPDVTIIVPASGYNPATETATGYILDDAGTMVSIGEISEEFAWEHDVLVVGANCYTPPPIPMYKPPVYSYAPPMPVPSRYQNQPEFGGIVQVTDLGNLESWINGKLEFRYVVFSSTGVKIKDRAFPKTKRKEFKDRNWKDFNDYICDWDTTIIGKYMIENWIEIDGGSKTTNVNHNIVTPPQCDGCPTTTTAVSYQIQSKDQDLGQSIVMFNNQKSQAYNITDLNFKRK